MRLSMKVWVRGVAAAGAVLLASGCGTVRETLPARSAMEELLISAAADDAVAKMDPELFAGKTVALDTANLKCSDKEYVVQRLRAQLLNAGARLVPASDDADIVLEAASGAMSMNKREYLFGVPALPFPVPFGSDTLKIPEIPLWKRISYRGRAKLLLVPVDPETGEKDGRPGALYGKSHETYSWFLLVGPLRLTSVHEDAQ